MMFKPERIVAMLLLVFLGLVTADGAIPRVLMVHGGILRRPIVVDDWPAMFQILDSAAPETTEPKNRPYLDLALFWGTEWIRYVENGGRLDRLRPADAKPWFNLPTRGRFYPACGSSPAVITITPVPPDTRPGMWRVSDGGLSVLKRFGVPMRVDCK